MKLHTFLTGEIQTGKSTLIRRWLEAHPRLRTGGFRTVRGPRQADGSDCVHIIPAVGQAALTEENCVIRRRGVYPERRLDVFTDVFDTVGTSLLQDAPECDVVVMDEIGFSEDGALDFRYRVLEVLAGKTPVIGVVRDRPGVLADAVRRQPGVRIITVTAQNRDAVLAELLERGI